MACNLEVLGSSPVLATWIWFTVALFSNPRPRFVNSQLVCRPPLGIFNKLNVMFSLYIYFTDLVSPVSATVLITLTLK